MSDSATSSFIDDHTPIITDTTTEDISDSSFDDVFSTIPPHLETTSEEIVDQNNESDYPYLTIEQLKYQIEQLEKGMYKKDKIIEQSKHEITQLKEEISEKDNVIMQSDYKIYQLGKKLNETDKITRSLGERLNEQKKLHEDGTSEILKKTPKIIRVKKMSCDALKEVVTLSPQTKPLNVCISYNIIIPSGYDKDVYYYEQQNRQQLFGFSNFNKIPVYFPIPVLKDKNNYSVVFEIYPQNYARRYIRICVTANGPKETKEE
ncbi:hypothetical protein QTN25_010498 [Entamoeba marina]